MKGIRAEGLINIFIYLLSSFISVFLSSIILQEIKNGSGFIILLIIWILLFFIFYNLLTITFGVIFLRDKNIVEVKKQEVKRIISRIVKLYKGHGND